MKCTLPFLAALFFLTVFPPLLQGGGAYYLSRFDGIFEPSGVAELQNGEIVVIEDEPDAPLWVLEPQWDGDKIILQKKREIILKSRYDDLEGIAVGNADDVFLITSHSIPKNGDRRKERERLLRVDLQKAQQREDSDCLLLSSLASRLGNDSASDHPINIEGLSFDGNKECLLLGLRSPTIGKRSLVLKLENPYACASGKAPPLLSADVFELDINGGIRALYFDLIAGRYLLANEITDENGKKRPALWSWQGNNSRAFRIALAGLDKVKNIEGITVFNWMGKNYLLLVCDDGKKKYKKGGHYLIVDYELLQLQYTQ